VANHGRCWFIKALKGRIQDERNSQGENVFDISWGNIYGNWTFINNIPGITAYIVPEYVNAAMILSGFLKT